MVLFEKEKSTENGTGEEWKDCFPHVLLSRVSYLLCVLPG